MLVATLLCLPLVQSADTAKKEAPFETISFASKDGREVTADLYIFHEDPKTPFIVLFHQAGWSRGEYREIAPRLGELGFNCMAVDQRSGKGVNGVTNQTAKRAAAKGDTPTYVDALPDMVAALEKARADYAEGELLAWGSSYSAALVLKLAGDHPELVDGVLAFSPGEYFVKLGESKTWIRDAASKIRCPVFVTSARNEKPAWQGIYAAIEAKGKMFFLPQTEGNHGSRALWKQFDDSADYWKVVERFLAGFVAD